MPFSPVRPPLAPPDNLRSRSLPPPHAGAVSPARAAFGEYIFERAAPRPSTRTGAALLRRLGADVPQGGLADKCLQGAKDVAVFCAFTAIPGIFFGLTMLQFGVVSFIYFMFLDHFRKQHDRNTAAY